jgi:1-deoxyxylulose-5-phosphate synthase
VKERAYLAPSWQAGSMNSTQLGTSGLKVSPICLGTMTFGLQADETTSRAILDTADELGITFIDTADVYPARGPAGVTEEILGRWLKKKRHRFVVASKCGGRVGPLPWDEGCSRKHIVEAVDASLRRLDTDYIDLFQLHVFDKSTPIEETLEALDILLRTGKVRYVGCSNWLAYQVALALGLSNSRRIVRFSSVQPRHNLLHRPAERELFPLCLDQGLGVITYNPLAGGLLTAKHKADAPPLSGTRFDLSPVYRDLYWHDRELATVQTIRQLAESAGISVTALAIAWSLTHPAITSTIIGATRPDQLAESTAGATTSLDADLKRELDRITESYLGGPTI